MTDKQTVLIVDDDYCISEAASLRLRAAGFETWVAHDGEAGFHRAKELLPDAIVLDIRMPVMDGLTALGHLKSTEQTRDIPVVMLSASVIDEEAALDSGARFFIRKPFSGPSLVEAVQAATGASVG